ncbi:MAG: YigZ family protein [Oscillochloris sp.]|nr:YigZ family protein [Oscillochloris sp.]
MEAARYPIPIGPAHSEILVINSRFIAAAEYTPTVEAARAFIASVRAAEPGANHHCYAYLVGYGASVTAGMSDDGEPGGTAGRPMLAVLRGADLGDVTVVVTRYFGGTLLGTGGLVRAYSDATRAVLALLERGERIARHETIVQVDYDIYAAVRRVLEDVGAEIADEAFAAQVQIVTRIPIAHYAQAAAALAELSAGRITLELPA